MMKKRLQNESPQDIFYKMRGEERGSKSHQPQRLVCWNLDREEDLVVRHIQNDLILRDQDVTATESVGTEGGVGVTYGAKSNLLNCF